MKYFLFVIIIFCSFFYSQSDRDSLWVNIIIDTNYVELDSVGVICDKRGHILTSYGLTAMHIHYYHVDLPDCTLVIYKNPNTKMGYCSRCSELVSEPAQTKPDTTVIWRRKDPLFLPIIHDTLKF